MIKKKSAIIPDSFVVNRSVCLTLLIFLYMVSYEAVAQSRIDDSMQQPFSEYISTEDGQKYGDRILSDLLRRLKGVQASAEGSPTFRGLGYADYYVTINGQRLATEGFGTRAFNLNSIGVQALESVTFRKVLTPDKPADGLVGALELKTFSPRDKRAVSAGLGGGAMPEYLNRQTPSGFGWIRYFDRISDKTDIAFNLSYLNNQRAAQTLGINYEEMDFGSGLIDLAQEINPALFLSSSNQLSGSVFLEYDHSSQTKFFVQGLINYKKINAEEHSNPWRAESSWNAPDSVSSGSYNYILDTESGSSSQYTFSAGGLTELDFLNIEYKVGFSQNKILHERYILPFQETSFGYTIDLANRENPGLDPLNELPENSELALQTMNLIVNNHIDNTFSGDLDFTMPIKSGKIKLGTSALLIKKDAFKNGAYSQYDYAYRGSLYLNGFESQDEAIASVFGGTYSIPRILDSKEAISFFESSIPNMRVEVEEFHRNSGVNNYFAAENVFSGYAMGDLSFGKLTIIGGLRAEYTSSEYEGRVVDFNRFDQYEETTDTLATNSYLNIFPNAQFTYDASEKISVSLAYSKTMRRPDFNVLAPFELLTPADTSIFSGNPNLSPIESDNFDLEFRLDYSEYGALSVGGFYKNISNNIQQSSTIQTIQEGDYEFFDGLFTDEVTSIDVEITTYSNDTNTNLVYGLEAGISQQLVFLPGILANLGTHLNYTWADSKYKAGGQSTNAYPGQRKHVFNAMLNYEKGPLFTQLSYHVSGKALNEMTSREQFITGFDGTGYPDYYNYGWKELSVSTQYKVSEAFMLFFNLYNLAPSKRFERTNDSSEYATGIYYRNGLEFNLGVKLSL